jgi:hypothetical protein
LNGYNAKQLESIVILHAFQYHYFSKQDDIKKTRSYDMNKHLTSLTFTILALLASGWFFIVASDASKKISIAIKYYFLYG